jgi:hypothetical protein
MKSKILALLLITALSGCGKEQSQLASETPTVSPPPTTQSNIAQCEFAFPNAGLCASLAWQKGPSADENSSLVIKFWNPSSADKAGPFSDPALEVKSFIQMQCCGSIFVPTVTKQSEGVYLVSDIRFLPGEWKLFVQLGNETDAEKVSLDVDLTR